MNSHLRVCSLPCQPSIGYGPQPCPFWQKKELMIADHIISPFLFHAAIVYCCKAFSCRCLGDSCQLFTTLPTWTTLSLCSWCKGGEQIEEVCFVTTKFQFAPNIRKLNGRSNCTTRSTSGCFCVQTFASAFWFWFGAVRFGWISIFFHTFVFDTFYVL